MTKQGLSLLIATGSLGNISCGVEDVTVVHHVRKSTRHESFQITHLSVQGSIPSLMKATAIGAFGRKRVLETCNVLSSTDSTSTLELSSFPDTQMCKSSKTISVVHELSTTYQSITQPRPASPSNEAMLFLEHTRLDQLANGHVSKLKSTSPQYFWLVCKALHVRHRFQQSTQRRRAIRTLCFSCTNQLQPKGQPSRSQNQDLFSPPL